MNCNCECNCKHNNHSHALLYFLLLMLAANTVWDCTGEQQNLKNRVGSLEWQVHSLQAK